MNGDRPLLVSSGCGQRRDHCSNRCPMSIARAPVGEPRGWADPHRTPRDQKPPRSGRIGTKRRSASAEPTGPPTLTVGVTIRTRSWRSPVSRAIHYKCSVCQRGFRDESIEVDREPFGAHCVTTDILGAGIAAPVAKETSHRIHRADFKCFAKHVLGVVAPATAALAIPDLTALIFMRAGARCVLAGLDPVQFARLWRRVVTALRSRPRLPGEFFKRCESSSARRSPT